MDGRKNGGAESSEQSRDRRGEVLRRLMKTARNIEGFQGKTVDEIFDSKNEQSRREIFRDFSVEQYSQLITGINGVLRGKDKGDWEMDGIGVTAAGHEVRGAHIFPRQEDKAEIIAKSWEAAERMNAAERDLQDIGMLLGSMLVETHPFADGNGRTSRLVYLLMKDGYSEERIRPILGEEGREEFDMALMKGFVDKLFETKQGKGKAELNPCGIDGLLAVEEGPYGDLRFPDAVSEEVRENIINAGRNDEKIFIAAILRFLQTHQELDADSMTKLYGERKVLLVQKILSAVPSEQIEELEQMYWNIKKIYTENLIDIFENPDRPEYMIERDGVKMRMLDYFKQRIAAGEMLC